MTFAIINGTMKEKIEGKRRMVRFLHCADLHLDRSFEGMPQLSKWQQSLLTVNQEVWQRIVDLAIEKQVDFVLLAGDTFHQNQPSLYIQNIFCQALQRLEKEVIEVVMCFGNHDYYTPQRYWFDFPENVHLFTEEAVSTLTLTTKSNERVAFSGFSYCQPWIEARKDIEFPYKAVDCDYHIGLYHGQQAGKYAPFQISELVSKGYDYWALGHIHVPTILNEQPAIVYPGTPQGHTKKEVATGVMLVELTPQSCHFTPSHVASLSFGQVDYHMPVQSQRTQVLADLMAKFSGVSPGFYQLHWQHLSEQQLLEYSAATRLEILDYLNAQLQRAQKDVFVYEIVIDHEAQETSPTILPSMLSSQAFASEVLAQQLTEELAKNGLLGFVSLEELIPEVMRQAQENLGYGAEEKE